MSEAMTHFWRVRKQLPSRFKEPCRLWASARGPGPRNVGVEFADGTRVVTTRWNVRRLVPVVKARRSK